MSNISDYIRQAFDYLNRWLPSATRLEAMGKQAATLLPPSLARTYEYAIAEIFGRLFMVAGCPGWQSTQRPSIIKRHHEALRHSAGMPVIMVFGKIPSYIFMRCTQKNIDMIVGEKRIFLPSLLFITEYATLGESDNPRKMPITAQLMILYHLQRERLDGLTTRELAVKLSISYPTVNRALNWLKTNGFIVLSGDKEKTVSFALTGRHLWETALPHLKSPVEKKVQTNSVTWLPESLKSGMEAAGVIPNEDVPVNILAISSETYKTLKDSIEDDGEYGETTIEVWRYDPRLLSDTGTVDILSLYLSLRDTAEERVREELATMMSTLAW